VASGVVVATASTDIVAAPVAAITEGPKDGDGIEVSLPKPGQVEPPAEPAPPPPQLITEGPIPTVVAPITVPTSEVDPVVAAAAAVLIACPPPMVVPGTTQG